MKVSYDLSVTTQGPTYPPSEVMNEEGEFVVIGRVNRRVEDEVSGDWGAALVSAQSELPPFGEQRPYDVVRDLDLSPGSEDLEMVLCTLPLPLPACNYPVVFAPSQLPDPGRIVRPSSPFHKAVPPDFRECDGLREMRPVTLGDWIGAEGRVTISLTRNARFARFEMEFCGLIPDSLYTVMSLRQTDLDPVRGPTRPGPLGIPNVLITDTNGNGQLWAELRNPFPPLDDVNSNRIINVILLWMSTRMSNGGALGIHGLGGDVHAQLKLQGPGFFELTTVE